ncbi:FHA domain-containing protein [Arthrobacter sp. RT-1]|uniref:FHA domain-containing protein n=1 Tax=Arthrobacter sp. RT-1 TaxID=2292263 RepID=UPI000E1F8834|nr:FHA domain-containing protein [Arthrobacter sp. RT-1]RDV09376.1 FHA domain-containing protein [Arthrobacter sp. RT-1]
MDAKVSRLIALGPHGSSGSELELTSGYMTLGRSHSNDLVLSEPSVSRVHASLTVDQDGRASVQDLGSSAGTTVNGRPASGPLVLRSGDVISFGEARFQYQGASEKPVITAALPVQRAPRPQPREEHIQGQYEIDNQQAGNISNVAGNQYTAYVSHVRQERESFLQAVAATRTKARWLIWIGVFLTLGGLVMAGGIFYQIFTGSFDADFNVFRELGGLYVIGVFAVMGGQLLMIIGIVLHVVATSRRKRVDRELPLPRPRGY